MKFLISRILTVGVVTFAMSHQAQAVQTRKCPDTIKFKFKSPVAKSEAEVKSAAEDFGLDEYEMKDVLAQRARFAGSADFRYRGTVYLLPTPESGVCRYANYDQQIAKFYTSNGRNILRVAERAGSQKIGFYVTVANDSYSKENGIVVASSESAGVSLQISDTDGEFSNAVDLGRSTSIELGL